MNKVEIMRALGLCVLCVEQTYNLRNTEVYVFEFHGNEFKIYVSDYQCQDCSSSEAAWELAADKVLGAMGECIQKFGLL